MSTPWDHWLGTTIIILDLLIIAVLLPIVIMQRRESGATLAWALAIIFIPIIGLLGFWLFGTTRLYFRKRKRRKVEAELAPDIKRLKLDIQQEAQLIGIPASIVHLAHQLDKIGPSDGNQVQIYREGATTFHAIETAFDEAKHHIHVLYYIWEADATGRRMRDALIRAAQRGVEVRVLVDDVGSRHTRRHFFKPLQQVGGQVGRFLKVNLLSRRININHRNHRKIIVIDGDIAFTGGMNIGNVYAGLAEPWLDLHAQIRGPVAKDLQETFCEDWYHATGENLVKSIYFPVSVLEGAVSAQFLASGPADQGWQAIYTMLFAAMGMATERIWVETPYFVPDRPLMLALQTAALRGVDVRLLLPAKSDHPLVYYAGRSFWDDLLRAGARIFEYYPAMIHAKAVMIDSHFVTLGSTNMDQRSFRLNFEGNLFIYDAPIAAQLRQDFLDLCHQAREVTLKMRARLPLIERFKESITHILAPLL
ncbi:MAG: cardiolipin synthase [Thiofilum sp.]|uniref:cardiolipin synthase n=1 Tax=Thiofilum sp. TaxID=2212733 RepID=UPI0025D9F0F3|nr:cardiolipin synthase [Thiofilum sp.]MBK8453964.1 cardiolipin synthase [Thiofilum sp.]